jgi:hypothetical protein
MRPAAQVTAAVVTAVAVSLTVLAGLTVAAGLTVPAAAGGKAGPVPPYGVWKVTRAPVPAGAAADPSTGIFGLTCPSVSTCLAFGSYSDTMGAVQGLLLTGHRLSLTATRGAWSAARAPLPAAAAIDPVTGLSAVACPSATDCVVAGSYADSAGDRQGLLLAGHGSAWTAVRAPLPAGAGVNPGTSLTAVACPSVTVCVVTGSYRTASGGQQGLLLTGDGRAWTVAHAPLPPGDTGADSWLSAVVCPSITICTATGGYLGSSDEQQGFLVTGSGPSWMAAQAPLPADSAADPGTGLASVTCPSLISCDVVGSYLTESGQRQGLLLAGHESSWTAAAAPLPADAAVGQDASLSGVTCPSRAQCAAAGSYAGPAGVATDLLTRRGSSWTAAAAPLPAGAASPGSWLSGLACAYLTACVATGGYLDSSGEQQGLLLTRRRSSWTAAAAPLPAGAAVDPLTSLTAVACPSVTTCAVVGSYLTSTGKQRGLLLTGPA